MAIINITKDNYEKEIVNSKIPVVVDFWAGWCGPCKMIAPVFEELSKEYENKIKFVKVDVDSEREIAMRYNIMSIPTLVVLRDGQEVDRIMGFRPKGTLKNEIEKLVS